MKKLIIYNTPGSGSHDMSVIVYDYEAAYDGVRKNMINYRSFDIDREIWDVVRGIVAKGLDYNFTGWLNIPYDELEHKILNILRKYKIDKLKGVIKKGNI